MDLIGNFCLFSESKRTEPVHCKWRFNSSFQTLRQFTRASHAYTYIRTIEPAQNVATPTIILNFREENFHDQKSNHEIHKNIVARKFALCTRTRIFAKLHPDLTTN